MFLVSKFLLATRIIKFLVRGCLGLEIYRRRQVCKLDLNLIRVLDTLGLAPVIQADVHYLGLSSSFVFSYWVLGPLKMDIDLLVQKNEDVSWPKISTSVAITSVPPPANRNTHTQNTFFNHHPPFSLLFIFFPDNAVSNLLHSSHPQLPPPWPTNFSNFPPRSQTNNHVTCPPPPANQSPPPPRKNPLKKPSFFTVEPTTVTS